MFKKPIVFVNYRRSDTAAEAGRLSSDLERAFGKGFVFQDIEDIESGEKWIDRLVKAGEDARVILAVIGPDWKEDENGNNRLLDQGDWVRKELEAAIGQNKTIIPVLVNNAGLPERSDLPESLRALLDHQAFDIRTDRWRTDLNLLYKDLSSITGISTIRRRQYRLTTYVISAVLLFGMVYLFTGSDWFGSSPPDNNGKTPIVNFCPEFEDGAEITTLLFPFKKVSGKEYDIATIVKSTMSTIVETYDIDCDIQGPNTDADQFYDLNEAKRKCPECLSDVVFTGFYYDQEGKIGVEPKIGFCDPSFNNMVLDEDRLMFKIEAQSIGQLSSDPLLLGAIDHVIQVFLGMLLKRNGDLVKSNLVLKDVVKDEKIDKALKKQALKIIWQNQYELGQKAASVKTLNQLYQINENNVKTLAAKSIVEFEQENYYAAIEDLDKVIERVNNTNRKNIYIEKRGDARVETQQFQKAKEDYQLIDQTPAVRTKIKTVDQNINRNNIQINGLQATTSLSDVDKAKLADLQLQNGRTVEAEGTLRTIDFSKLTEAQKTTLKSNQQISKLIKERQIQGN